MTARLFGAAERLRETIDHALFGNVPTVVAAVAWEDGHALLGEQAVATALEIPDALVGEHGDVSEIRDLLW